jgi:hypothetical protein
MPIIYLQQRFAIRYYILRYELNHQIQAKLCFIYGKYALCPYTLDTWAARFRSGRTFVKKDKKPGRPSRDDFSAADSGYLARNLHALYCKIVKELFFSITLILQALGKMSFRFFNAN